MKRLIVVVALGALCVQAWAVRLSCRQEEDTRRTFCYDPLRVRSNGDLRAFTLYMGGPNGVDETGQTAVFNCRAGYLELRDRQGVVFARDQPEKLHVVQLREDVCSEKKARPDPKLN